jgi:hypothetical protein
MERYESIGKVHPYSKQSFCCQKYIKRTTKRYIGYFYGTISNILVFSVPTIDTSHYRLLFGFSLLNKDRVPFECSV